MQRLGIPTKNDDNLLFFIIFIALRKASVVGSKPFLNNADNELVSLSF